MAVQEVMIWVMLSFSFCVVLVSIQYVYSQVTTHMDSVFNTPAVTTFFTKISGIWAWLDYTLLVSYISFLSGSLILGYFINSHPVFYVPYMIAGFFITFVSWIMKEVYLEFIMSFSGFEAIYNNYPYTQFMMENMPFFVLFACFLIATIQYSKASQGLLSQY